MLRAMRLLTLIGVFVIASAAAPAAAQSALVIVPDARVEAVTLERARAAGIEVLAERGIRLVPTPDGEPCEEADCAAALAGSAGADFAALLRVEPTEEGRQVRAVVIGAGGGSVEETAAVEDGAVRSAARVALEAALDRRGGDGRGFLLVTSAPPGARVEIDGRDAGFAPLRRMVGAGAHRVRITAEGGEPSEHEVEVTAGEELSVTADAASEIDAPPPDPVGPTRTEPSLWNWLIGGALALGGIITLLSPLQTISQQGQCVDEIEDVGCVERVQFGAQSGVLMGIGVSAIIAAIVVDAVAPLRVEVTAGPDAAGVRVEGRF